MTDFLVNLNQHAVQMSISFVVEPVIKFLHDVVHNVAVVALPTVREDESIIPIDLEPPPV